MTRRRLLLVIGLAWVLATGAVLARAAERYITVASTTSTEQSGLFRHILPPFEQKTGIRVRVIALGTGQALDMGRRGDADVVLVHDREAEEKFVAEEYGVERKDLMYNVFILIGQKSDPARIGGGKDVVAAMRSIAAARAPFISRGDRSGTHAAELRFWKLAGVDVTAARGSWYRETGSGMGPALNTAAGMNAYVLSDRGTWISFKNRGELAILVEGDRRLFNEYGVMLVNPARHPHVKKDLGDAFIAWLVSPAGQQAIADYRIGGEQLFFPNARAARKAPWLTIPASPATMAAMKRYRGLTLRILGRRSPAMGPGRAQLIAQIEKTGSISAAAREMGMSYRRAWQLVEALNQSFTRPVVITAVGGRRGGGAVVTEFGKCMVALYHAMESKASAAIATDVRRFSRHLRKSR